MSELLEDRLRRIADERYVDGTVEPAIIELMEDAADEIERLRVRWTKVAGEAPAATTDTEGRTA